MWMQILKKIFGTLFSYWEACRKQAGTRIYFFTCKFYKIQVQIKYSWWKSDIQIETSCKYKIRSGFQKCQEYLMIWFTCKKAFPRRETEQQQGQGLCITLQAMVLGKHCKSDQLFISCQFLNWMEVVN